MKIYHHNDEDGRCAGYWAWKLNGENAELYEVDYHNLFGYGNIEPDEELIFVDFHLPVEMTEHILNNLTTNLTMIDHHPTTIELYRDIWGWKFKDNDLDFDYVFSETTGAGCELTYLYYTNEIESGTIFSDLPNKRQKELLDKVPHWTRLIADRDTWAWELDDTKYFHNALLASNQNIDDNIEDSIYYKLDYGNVPISDFLDNGEAIDRYRTKMYKKIMDEFSYESSFRGHSCVVCNHPEHGSVVFGGLFEKYDMCISYRYDGNIWEISLYSDGGVDAGSIAQEYGGGGHAGAAGFHAEELPDEIRETLKLN